VGQNKNDSTITGEDMSDDSFLINAFDGHLGIDRLRVFRNIEPDDKTRQLTRQFHEIQEEYPAAYLDAEGVIPPEAMDRLKQIGFFGLNIPVEYGGSGLDLWQYLQVVEEIISRNMSLGFTALAHLSIGIKGILLYGTDAQKKKYLPLAASGAMIFSYALTEPDRGSDAQHIQTTATLSADGRHYILNGRKTYITNANYADGLTVFAQMDSNKPGFMGAFVVETGWKGVKIGKDMPKMGLKASSTAAIQFKNVEVPVENLLGRPGDGFKIAMTILNYGRLALGAGSTGMMRQSLADMKKRAATRTQFDIPINRFELIQEMLVRARVNGYIASAITAFTASMLPADPLAVVAIESSHTKLFGTTRAWLTLYDALQVAGGAGYLATLPYELRMRDFRVATIFEGTTEIHSIYPALFVIRRLAKELRGMSKNKFKSGLFLLKNAFKRMRWQLRFNQADMDRAVGVARANARWMRFLVYAGLLLYGEKIFHREFLLRRITDLSLHMYGILAALARIDAARKAGKKVSKDIDLLNCFVIESRLVRRRNTSLFPTRSERLNKKIAAALTAVIQ
jgi:acyl-CoA dehydrogenase family protein 9